MRRCGEHIPAARFGARLALTSGPALSAAGLALMTMTASTPDYRHGLFPAIVALGFDMTIAGRQKPLQRAYDGRTVAGLPFSGREKFRVTKQHCSL